MTTPGNDGLDTQWSSDVAFHEAHDCLTASRQPDLSPAEAQTHALQAIAYALLGLGITTT